MHKVLVSPVVDSSRAALSRRSRCTGCARSSGAGPTAAAASRTAKPCRAQGRHLHDGPRRVRRDPRPERLGQVDARPPALDAAAARRRLGASSATTCHRARAPCAGSSTASRSRRLLQAHVRRGEPRLRGAVLRHDARADRGTRSRAILRGSASRPSGAASRWRTSPAACSRRWRSRGRCPPRRCCCSSTSRRRGSTRARSSRCRSSSARSAPHTTRRSSSARTTWPRPRRSPTGSASSTGASCSRWSRSRSSSPLRRRDARGGVLRRDRPDVRGRDRRGRRAGGVRLMAHDPRLRDELIGLGGVVERNFYLVRATPGGTSRSSSGRSRTR